MKVKQLWHERPGAVLGVIQTGLVAAVTFGVPVSKEQGGAVLLVASAVLTLVADRTVTPADVDPALAVDPATVLSTSDLWPDEDPDADADDEPDVADELEELR